MIGPSPYVVCCCRDLRAYPTDPDDYVLIEELGKGATATVYLAYCQTLDVDVALKIVNLDDEQAVNLVSPTPYILCPARLHI